MKKSINKIIKSLSIGWKSEERETSILFDHYERVVYLETSEPFTARRWYDLLKNHPNAKFDTNVDTLKITVPFSYCRKPELILIPKYRNHSTGKPERGNTHTANERSLVNMA